MTLFKKLDSDIAKVSELTGDELKNEVDKRLRDARLGAGSPAGAYLVESIILAVREQTERIEQALAARS